MIEKHFSTLRGYLDNSINESEVKLSFAKVFSTLGIELNSERLNNDGSYNNVIIEYKDRGFFKGSLTARHTKNALEERILPYTIKKSKLEHEVQSHYKGVATDGEHIIFCHVSDDRLIADEILELNAETFNLFNDVLQNANERSVTTENLVEDFGVLSNVGNELMGALSKELSIHYSDPANNKIKMLFSEWRSFYGQVSGLTTDQLEAVKKSIRFDLPKLSTEKEDKENPKESASKNIAGLLFVIHTYNSLVMKLLGAEIVSKFHSEQDNNFCLKALSQSDSEILSTFSQEVESGRLFERARIKGFVEEAMFSWYLDVTEDSDKQDVISAIRQALRKLVNYKLDNLTAARSRDVLKGFYQALVPDVLRKSLGEFYTPDWLVEFTLEQCQVTSWLNQRVLDPTCGSGSFLLNVINRKREEAVKKHLSPTEQIDLITESVWGFDLNPLAVQTARINYLIAISDLLQQVKSKKIEIPIVLADSVYSTAREANDKSENDIIYYNIGSSEADLKVGFPLGLVKQSELFDRVLDFMSSSVLKSRSFDELKVIFHKNLPLKDKPDVWIDALESSYEEVLKLHKRRWNGIWFKIIRNFYRTITAGIFDLIVGNPPWVRWSALPVEYRNRVHGTCEQYEIFSDSKYHGGNELDISCMITYTVADTWLSDKGVVGFVIPQNHFQTPSSQGFRSFTIDKKFSLKPEVVHDFKELKPFSAANKTAVVRFRKAKINREAMYPVNYKVWHANQGTSKKIPESSSYGEVFSSINYIDYEANPVEDLRSPWAIMKPGHFNLCSMIHGKSDWIKGRKGVTADLNSIYMVHIHDVDEDGRKVKIKTRPEAGKKKIGNAKSYWIEVDLLYPLIKGASDFKSCYFKPKKDLYLLVPNKGIVKDKLLEAENFVETQLPETYSYFNDYKDWLLDRSTYKARLSKYDFYHVYNVGDYSFSPYKVIWAEQSGTFRAAVASSKDMPLLGNRPYVPDHKIYFVDCYSEISAFYLCGLLTSNIVKEYVESHTVSIQVGNIFKHMELPQFDQDNSDMVELASLTKAAHTIEIEKERADAIKRIGLLADEVIKLEGK